MGTGLCYPVMCQSQGCAQTMSIEAPAWEYIEVPVEECIEVHDVEYIEVPV